MARITMSALADAIQGRMGPVDFQRGPGGPRVRIHSQPGRPASAQQLEQRESIRRSALLWSSIKAPYTPWAELDPRDPLLSPMLLHHAASVARIRAGTPWNLLPYELPPWTTTAWKARSLSAGDVTLQVDHSWRNAAVIQGVGFYRANIYHRIGAWGAADNDVWNLWLNCPVPQGAPVSAAHIVYNSRSTRGVPGVHYVLKAQAEDDAHQILNITDYDAVTWTTETAAGQLPAWTAGVWYDTVDCADVLQEVFDRPGYEAGNAVGITTADPGTATNAREPMSWSNDPAKAAKLYIEWGEAPTPPPDVWLRAEWDAGLDVDWSDFALLRRDAAAWTYVLEDLYTEPLTPNTLDFQVTPGLSFHDLFMVLRESIAPSFQELPSIRCVPDGTWQFPHS